MLDAIVHTRPATGQAIAALSALSAAWYEPAPGVRAAERRSTASLAPRCLALMLDEVDYGMLLLGESGSVLHLNHAARAELDDEHPLQLLGRTLRARRCEHVARLHEALDAAQRGLRRLLTLQGDGAPVSIAVIPLGPQGDDGEHMTLLVLGKRHVCERLSVQWFARSHALTPTETRVLEALCEGLDPRDVAAMHGVGLATVRSQIGSIRVKTGAQSIRDLVRQVCVLPPMLSCLREKAA